MLFHSLAYLLLAGVGEVFAKYNKAEMNNIAMYWGQNSAGSKANKADLQVPLGEYCKMGTDVDIFIIAFVLNPSAPDHPLLNFANQGGKCKIGTDRMSPVECPDIGNDITTCQNTYNKTILLSTGGSSGKVSFASAEAAIANAQAMWDMFGTPSKDTKSGAPRPFGGAAVDGFDIDVETKVHHLEDWAQKLRNITTQQNALLTAAPQCPFAEDPMKNITDKVAFDAVFVQFYNNGNCMYGGNGHGAAVDEWEKWAKEKNSKFFLGLPASNTATPLENQGYLLPDAMATAVSGAKTKEHFGGVMLWDASQSFNNGNYHVKVKEALNKTASG
ncbi:glycoside hydrolase [Byssothecium circinans]|uniref:Glycoside hydrolase n=1 Tax=Byssothecium circinans TaxID=147558 RepID=A0A6A5TDD5_9PLEO|nr:glycoside hydrolase [Byssothecium circinans]